MAYIRTEITVDDDQILADAYAAIQAVFPAWVPRPGNLDAVLLTAISRLAGEQRGLMVVVTDAIFATFGRSILGLAQLDAQPALGSATFTLTISTGQTIPAGTGVAAAAADGSLVAFQTTTDLVIPNASTSGSVAIAAVEPGTAGNGLTGSLVLLDAVPNVSTIVLAAATSLGVDAEPGEAYLARLADRMQLVAVHPILAVDYALLAMTVPGVARALAVDGYDPGANTSGNARTVAVFPQAADGTAVSSGIKTAVQTLLAGDREVNFVVDVADPLYTAINVAATVAKRSGADSTQTQTDVATAIAAFLSPATWGAAQTDADPPWSSKPVVRFNDVLGAIYRVSSVDHVTTLTVNAGSADVTMQSGKPQALPTPGTITVTVT